MKAEVEDSRSLSICKPSEFGHPLVPFHAPPFNGKAVREMFVGNVIGVAINLVGVMVDVAAGDIVRVGRRLGEATLAAGVLISLDSGIVDVDIPADVC